MQAVPDSRPKIAVSASKGSHSTATFIIVDKTRVYGRLTNERVAPVDGIWGGSILFGWCRSADKVWLVVDLLLTDGARIEHLYGFAVGRTSKGKSCVCERATPISIQATAIAGIPEDISTRLSYLAMQLTYQKLAPHQIDCGFP